MKSTKITKIKIYKVESEIKDIGRDKNSQWMTYNPGKNLPQTVYLTNIYTDVGEIGQNCLHMQVQ